VPVCNQLRAHLAVAFPCAVGVFLRAGQQASPAFLARFGSQDAADQLN
jgi:hypothetical protein